MVLKVDIMFVLRKLATFNKLINGKWKVEL